MERLKSFLVEEMIKLVNPRAIYEKCTSAARRLEGLDDAEALLYGTLTSEVKIVEHGISHIVPIVEGQKTGFFLDQREMRKKILELSSGKKVLNCFAYTGGFSLAALKGGATFVHSVEISEEACRLAEKNNFNPEHHKIFQRDAFDFLQKEPLDYDIVILDPPAFAKKLSDVTPASNRISRDQCHSNAKNALFLTSSHL